MCNNGTTTNTIEAYGSEPHYLAHLAGVLRDMPNATLVAPTDGLAAYAERFGLPTRQGLLRQPGPPALIAGYRDARDVHPDRPLALVEHGAGQTYLDVDHQGYAGGPGWSRLDLVLAPGPHCANRWIERYPTLAVAQIGVPGYVAAIERRPEPALVGVTFHWECRQTAEAGSAFRDWRDALGTLDPTTVLGHWHPKWAARNWVRRTYERLGIAWTTSTTELLTRCAVLVADNTSLMYEAAALDIPVLALNAAGWRKDVEHGLRFWSHVPGHQLDPGDDLLHGIAVATEHGWVDARQHATAVVYQRRHDPGEVLNAWVHRHQQR